MPFEELEYRLAVYRAKCAAMFSSYFFEYRSEVKGYRADKVYWHSLIARKTHYIMTEKIAETIPNHSLNV